MRALVFHGPGAKSWDEVPDPKIEDDLDVVVRARLGHHLRHGPAHPQGRCAQVRPGTVLGHEAVGEIVEVGSDVRTVRPREQGSGLLHHRLRALLPTAVRAATASAGGGGGWDPRPPDRRHPGRVRPRAVRRPVRTPAARRHGTAPTPSWPTLPTSYEVGVSAATSPPGTPSSWSAPGRSVSPRSARPAVLPPERDRRRRPGPRPAGGLARKPLGADAVARRPRGSRAAGSPDLTDGLGADVVIEAVGVPESFELCTRMVRPGGHVANVGVHGKPRDPAPRRPVDKEHHHHHRPGRHLLPPPTLLRMAAAGRLPTLSQLVTPHVFPLDPAMEEAYDVFGRAADTGALKVLMTV